MKKILYVAMVVNTYTSYASDECICDNIGTITEEDAKDSNTTLSESCEFAKESDPSCEIK